MSPVHRACVIAFLLAAAGAGGWALARAAGTSPAPGFPDGVELVTVARGDLAVTTSLTGVVVPRDRVAIGAGTDGVVSRVRVSAGMFVEAEQPLFDLDTGEAALALAEASLDVRLAALDVRDARCDEAGACRDRERRQIALDRARLAETAARRRLAQHTVRAPAAGRILEVHASAGDRVGPAGDPVAVLMRGDTWDIDVEVDEFDVTGLKTGAPASTIVPAHSPVPCLGEVLTPPHMLRMRTGVGSPALFRVRVSLRCARPLSAGGLSAYVDIERARREDVVLLPLRAVFRHRDADFVALMKGTAIEPRPVTLGLADTAVAEVLSGVDENDRVLAGPADRLRRAAFGLER